MGSSDKCLPIINSDITLILHCNQKTSNFVILKSIVSNILNFIGIEVNF